MGKRGIFQITMNSLFICTFTERRRPPPGGDGTGDGSVGGGNKYNLSLSSQFPYFCRLFITYLFISRQDAYSVLNFEYIKNHRILFDGAPII
jgi:hypothetical protein